MKQRIACLVLVDLRDSMGRPSDEDTAALLCRTGIIMAGRAVALKTIRAMVDAGHRYRNLQSEISSGLPLVLGISLPEYWFVHVQSLLTAISDAKAAGPVARADRCLMQ